jgi:hypothetical protein
MKHRHVHIKGWCIRCWWFTVSFPIEHYLWEKAPVFAHITKAIGL